MTPREPDPLLSVIIPMKNEIESLDLLFPRLQVALEATGLEYEVLCVDDGSTDGTIDRLLHWNKRDGRIKIVSLSRNFGKEAALTAGIDHAAGDIIVPLDADLQDPPELIAEMYRQWLQGADVVYGVRRTRNSDSPAKRLTAQAFYRLFNQVGSVPIPADTGDFRLMDRCVTDALRLLPERNRFMKGLFAWVGFKQVPIYYDRPERIAGHTKFNFWRLWNFALDGLTGFTTGPLRIWLYIGGAISMIAFLYGTILFCRTLLFGVDLPGYASLMVAVLFLGGLQILSLGILGEYVGRLYHETKARPLYLTARTIGIDRPKVPSFPGERCHGA